MLFFFLSLSCYVNVALKRFNQCLIMEPIFQELQISINRLGERVAPWLKIRMSGDPSMTQIISAVDKIVYDDGIIREKVQHN